jgi:hypothetical protein
MSTNWVWVKSDERQGINPTGYSRGTIFGEQDRTNSG